MGKPKVAIATVAAATQAAPPISPLIELIPADGLMEMPPVSKVTPEKQKSEVRCVTTTTMAVA